MAYRFLQIVKNDVYCLNKLSENDVIELIQLSFNYIKNGLPKSVLNQQSQLLGLSKTDVEKAITGIAFLLLEFFKYQQLAENCELLSQELDLSPAIITLIYKCYRQNETELGKILQDGQIKSHQFRDLEWRLETQLSSRSLHSNGLATRAVLKISLENQGKIENTALIADIPNIIHFSQMVEQALSESRNQNARKIQKIIF